MHPIQDDRSEEQKVIDFVHAIPGGKGAVRKLSVAERAQLPDFPDLRIYLFGVAFWAEIKRPPRDKAEREKGDKWSESDRDGDKLSKGQLDFLRAEYDHGQIVFAGGRAELEKMMKDGPPSAWRRLGWEAVAVIVARGLRDGAE